jgi:hypothetical protein
MQPVKEFVGETLVALAFHLLNPDNFTPRHDLIRLHPRKSAVWFFLLSLSAGAEGYRAPTTCPNGVRRGLNFFSPALNAAVTRLQQPVNTLSENHSFLHGNIGGKVCHLQLFLKNVECFPPFFWFV